ncbi:hypothetical protein J6590_001063 [Homalodisca vitripennis]|nr:hypothetical protein J6590_001063 [Homalodisca vitripennis]
MWPLTKNDAPLCRTVNGEAGLCYGSQSPQRVHCARHVAFAPADRGPALPAGCHFKVSACSPSASSVANLTALLGAAPLPLPPPPPTPPITHDSPLIKPYGLIGC